MGLSTTIVHEDGDRVYLIGPVTPIEPSAQEIEEYAFGRGIVDQAAEKAPNQFIRWFGGHYVEADNPNGNGAMWTAKEIAIKSATPMYMPVTVMHDPGTAVGLIADVALRTPDKDQVPRPKLDTALALWAHRFPEVIEEAEHNHAQGTLMQSMECLAPAYDCAVCGMGFFKLPGGAERKNWCAHLKGEEGATAVRILRATTFTGTGLIFGSRGASGADPLAHLDDFKQEVAEFHQKGRVNKPNGTASKTRSKHTMEIEDAKYEELVQRPTKDALDTEVARADRAEKEFERVEAENVTLRTKVENQDAEIASFKEQANQATLRDERLGKLGDKFMAALGDGTRTRLNKQAGEMQDAEWAERLSELAELVKVEPDAKLDPAAAGESAATGAGAPAPGGTPTFSQEELARQQVRGDLGESAAIEPTVSRNVIAGLVSRRPSTKAKS